MAGLLLQTLMRLAHPAVFGKRTTGKIPFSAQLVAMLCPHRTPIFSLGRDTGKSDLMIAQGEVAKVVVLPPLLAYLHRLTRPVPVDVVLIASVKEQAFELQAKIQNVIQSADWLRAMVSVDSTKTNIVFDTRSRIMVRPATNAARGLHAKTFATGKGIMRGALRVLVDEGWFLRQADFYHAVVSPMMGDAGPGSRMAVYSTPYGQQGEVWDMWSDARTGDCAQPYVVDGDGRRQHSFDRAFCQQCMMRWSRVRHNFASTENPYINRRYLLEEKRRLLGMGLKEVWKQEYLGIPSSTSGLFFKPEHQGLMWNDELPEYRISDSGDFVRRLAGSVEEGAVEELVDLSSLRLGGGDYFLGIDPNQGIESKRADYAAVALVEMTRQKKAVLWFCMRFRKALPYFDGIDYRSGDVTPFVLAAAVFLIEHFGVKRVFVDQNFGQAYYVPLVQRYGESRIQYIPGSLQQKQHCLVHWRSMIERGKYEAPAIKFLVEETRYLQVEQDSLDEDKVRVDKAKGWGTQGAQVDGTFAVAYAMRGTEELASVPLFGTIEPSLIARPGMGDLVKRMPFQVRVMGRG